MAVWARLSKRVHEVEPLECAACGGAMKIIGFIERRLTDVSQRILRDCGLRQGFIRTQTSPRLAHCQRLNHR